MENENFTDTLGDLSFGRSFVCAHTGLVCANSFCSSGATALNLLKKVILFDEHACPTNLNFAIIFV